MAEVGVFRQKDPPPQICKSVYYQIHTVKDMTLGQQNQNCTTCSPNMANQIIIFTNVYVNTAGKCLKRSQTSSGVRC